MKIGEEILIDYLSGELTEEEALQIENELKSSAPLRLQLESLRDIKKEIEDFDLFKPSPNLKDSFESILNKEILEQSSGKAKVINLKKWRKSIMTAAAILVLGLFIGLQVQTYVVQQQQIASIESELESTRQQMKELLATKSTSKRIQAVNMSMELPKADQEMIDQLIEIIHKDQSPNVRLTAIEAIIQFDQSESIQRALTSALRIEDKPVVQIALIHALISIKADMAIPILDELIEKEETFDKVKDEARLGKFKLS